MNADRTQTTSTQMPLADLRELHQEADQFLRAIYEKKTAWAALPAAYQLKMRAAYATVKNDRDANWQWQRLLNHLGSRADLFSVRLVDPALGPQPGNTYLDALLQLALSRAPWLRPLEAWEPETSVAREQFASLLRHLLTLYTVPSFLDAAWFEGFTLDGERHRDWFALIGTGANIRTAELPLRLTSKAAHYTLQAPSVCSIVGALRWGQTLALGGNKPLAEAIVASRLRSILPDEPFWASVIHFFVNNQSRLDLAQVGPIVDYLYAQKFGDETAVDAEGHPDIVAGPEPALTMKGRTLHALCERMREWHEELARNARRLRNLWKATGIQPLTWQDRSLLDAENEWRIVELLSGAALMEEGRAMRNCVLRYSSVCQSGAVSIWSLRVRHTGETTWHRLLTIEVDNARRAIVQVRRRCNRAVDAYQGSGRLKTAVELLRRWAREQGLTISCNL